MKVIFTPTAQEHELSPNLGDERGHYARLTPYHRKRIRTKLRHFAGQPNPLEFAEPLTGSAEYRFRVGDYRVIFEILHGAIWIKAIKRRDEVYR